MTRPAPSPEVAAALIGDLRDLPTPPQVFTQIVRAVDDPNSSAYDVAQLISEDPAMSAKVLRITNSAYYGLAGEVTSIKHAVVIIGLEGVKSVVVSTSVIDMFQGDRVGRAFQDTFWRHSLLSAFGARLLMRTARPDEFGASELAFTGGLLHDIGKVILYLHAPGEWQTVTRRAVDEGVPELDAELEAYGCHHADVGRALTDKWNLPTELGAAIGGHHDPLALEAGSHLASIIHIADGLAYHAIAESDASRPAPSVDPAIFARSGLELEQISGFMEQLRAEYLNAQTFLNMARSQT